MKTYIIAELGSSHDNKIDVALNLIDCAKSAGAQAVKAQYWSSADRMAGRRHAPAYRDTYAKYQIPVEWLDTLKQKAHASGLDFICTTYLPEDVAIVLPFCDRMKIASFEANDPELLVAHQMVLRAKVPLLVSLGMGAQFDPVFKHLINVCRDDKARVCFLHCVSAYPTGPDDLHLAMIRSRGLHGFSDHSYGDDVLSGALAVAAGAGTVERHIRAYSTARDNPDYDHSMLPGFFDRYVASIRMAEAALGSRMYQGATDAEAAMLPYRVLPGKETLA